MDICVLPDYKAKEFVAFCEVLQIKKNTTVEKMLESGFTNFYKPHFLFCKIVYQDELLLEFKFIMCHIRV